MVKSCINRILLSLALAIFLIAESRSADTDDFSTSGAPDSLIAQFANATTTNINNASGFTEIPMNTASGFNDSIYVDLDGAGNGGDIRVDETGVYRVTYNVTYDGDNGNTRKAILCEVHLNGSAATPSGQTIAYCRHAQSVFAFNSASVLVEVTNVGDIISIACQRAPKNTNTNTVPLVSGASTMTIEKVK